VQAAIEARAVSHRTRAGEVAVRDISFTIGYSELVAIIGGRGSGKTTLLDAMSGLRPPTSGTVDRPAGRVAGYVPDVDTLPAVLPLARALRYTAELRSARTGVTSGGGADDGYRGVVTEALDLAGLAAAARVPAGALTAEERKRASVAAELVSRPAQLFLEEPTAALDPAQGAEVLRLLRRLADGGSTVVLTTSSPLDAARCDKVVVLATGGHLAFFGTPAAALGYFGADSLEEIFERLAGFGDPAAAWSRRFFAFSRTRGGFTPQPSTPPSPGPAVLLPDAAGPHSAGRVSADLAADSVAVGDSAAGDDLAGDDLAGDDLAAGDPVASGDPVAVGEVPSASVARLDSAPPGPAPIDPRPVGPARQWAVLTRRDAEVLARDRHMQAVLAGTPVAILLAFCVLLGCGALDGRGAVTLAWAVLGGLIAGLAYQLPARAAEAGILRRERFAGLSTGVFVLAKVTVLLPLLALADVLILAVPAIDHHLTAGYGIAYLAVLLSSLAGLAIALAAPVRQAAT
jgi:ABC-type multidrug transport system ATPase subunit